MFRNRLPLALAALLFIGPAFAQVTPGSGVSQSGAVIPGDCAAWLSTNNIEDAGAPCGGGAAAAGTLTGATLAPNVVNSSLTSVGTITTGTWAGTPVSTGHGGTGVVTGLTVLNASNITTGGPIAVAQGGTSGTSASKATANAIGAAEIGANSSITSLTGLTTPLSSAQGGFVSTATTYTPTITCTGGTGCTVGSVTAAFSINGKWLFLRVSGTVTFTVTGTLITIPLPSGVCSGNNSYSGVDSNNLGGGAVAGICAAGASTITASLVGVTSGDILAFNGLIQLQ